MKLYFKFPKGDRVHRYFWAVCLRSRSLWWNHDNRKWEPLNTTENCNYSTHAPCKTVKAFKRMLRKNPQIQGDAVLVSRYIGYTVHDHKVDEL